MHIKNVFIIFSLCCLACKNTRQDTKPEKFDRIKWGTTDGREYAYRDRMLKDLIANYKLKGLSKNEVVDMLGQPNRSDSGYLFYTVAQEFFANTSWPLRTKTLVIKLTKDSTVEWRKIHE